MNSRMGDWGAVGTLAMACGWLGCSTSTPSQKSDQETVGEVKQAVTSPLSNLRSKLATYRDGNWSLDVNGNGVWDGCSTDRCLTFGGAGDLPIAGDWSGDGVVSIGVYRPSENAFLLDWNHNGWWDG